MITIIHKETCIGGVKGPCNCGAVEQAEKLQYHARRRAMLNTISGALDMAGSMEREAQRLVAYADRLKRDLDDLDKLYNIQPPAVAAGVVYVPIDNPA